MKAKELATLLKQKGIRVEECLEAGVDNKPVVRLSDNFFVAIWGDEDFTLNRQSSTHGVQPLGSFNTVTDLVRAISKI